MDWIDKMLERISNPQIFSINKMRTRRKFKNLIKNYPTRPIYVPLKTLYPNHKLNTTASIRKMNRRITTLTENSGAIVNSGYITLLQEKILIPSMDVMTVTCDKNGKYSVISGNGRYYALLHALRDYPHLLVQVNFVDHYGNTAVLNALEISKE